MAGTNGSAILFALTAHSVEIEKGSNLFYGGFAHLNAVEARRCAEADLRSH
jgi:hypothetical protein